MLAGTRYMSTRMSEFVYLNTRVCTVLKYIHVSIACTMFNGTHWFRYIFYLRHLQDTFALTCLHLEDLLGYPSSHHWLLELWLFVSISGTIDTDTVQSRQQLTALLPGNHQIHIIQPVSTTSNIAFWLAVKIHDASSG